MLRQALEARVAKKSLDLGMCFDCDPAYRQNMTTGTAAGESICKTFVTAVLLSGSAEWAEAAMLDGIASGDGDEELLERTVTSLLRSGARLEEGESTPSLASLPEGLGTSCGFHRGCGDASYCVF